jgi:hypothetical protein
MQNTYFIVDTHRYPNVKPIWVHHERFPRTTNPAVRMNAVQDALVSFCRDGGPASVSGSQQRLQRGCVAFVEPDSPKGKGSCACRRGKRNCGTEAYFNWKYRD